MATRPDETHDSRDAAVVVAGSLLADSSARRWEIFAKQSITRQTELVRGKLDRTLEVAECGVGVRTFDGLRAGFASASGFGRPAVERTVRAALAGAVEADDPMPPARLIGSVNVAPGPNMPARGWAQHIGNELELALASLSDGRIGLERLIIQEGRYCWVLATGEGCVIDHQRVAASILVEIRVGERSGLWREWLHVADPETFDPAAAAARVGNRALLTEHDITSDHGLHDLILHPEVSAHLFAGIAPLFLARDEATDPLPRLLDPQGLLAAYAVTVVDDRADASAPVVGPCDGEGLPARRTLLLDEGAPRHRVASFADARRFDETPRGGAVRLSYRDCPTSGFANLMIVTDDGSPATELLAASRRALYLLRPVGPVVCDLEADRYSIIASGVWLKQQRVCGWHPVVELSGGLGAMLRRIEAVGTDLGWYQTAVGFVGAPSLLIRRQPVVG